ncbi:TniQ family protein [Kitasatospora sp. NPDC096128]|uniref:TniQ family protein n=1 Tax=Kitasatospora sp. NPDC096128 TaxID=3155547 RepID=UPI0033198085
MNRIMDPLPRSLSPLPDESLPGFLLRLAHRLDLSPSQLIWRTGLGGDKPGSRALAGHLLMLEAAPLEAFAAATRLAPIDAEALTLRPFLRHYPPLTRALVREGSQPRPRNIFPPGLLAAYSRYCPLCLAGDGSPVQNKYGGPWKRQWRLAITFACLDHNVFLRHHCPTCGQLALSGYPDSPLSLMPSAGAHGLHAAQCRNSRPGEGRHQHVLCRQPLDQVAPPDLELSPDLAELQRRLLARLDGRQPAELAAQGFADLHVVSSIVRATWPAAIDHVPEETRTALTDHVSVQESLARSTWPRANNRGRRSSIAWTTPPAAAPAMAAMLFAAERLITAPEQPDALAELLPLAPVQKEPRWDDTWRTLARDSSQLLRQRIDRDYRVQFPPEWIRHGTPIQWIAQTHRAEALFEPVVEVRDRGFGPEHIPQRLPDDWFRVFADHAGLPAPSSQLLRRIIPIQMVQSVTSLGFQDAAEFLGIPTEWITTEPRRLHPLRLHSQWRTYDFPGAVERLAGHIAHNPGRTDYKARRRFFASWNLDDEDWERLCQPHARVGTQKTRSRIRDCVSALIWSRATGSEFVLAPVFHPPWSSPDRGLPWTSLEMTILSRWDKRSVLRNPPRFRALFEAVEELATEITRTASGHTP